jgi:hypothetical protein
MSIPIPAMAGALSGNTFPSIAAKGYTASPSVSDRFVITANGLAPFAFAAVIFRALAPERQQDIETYEELYSHGMLD